MNKPSPPLLLSQTIVYLGFAGTGVGMALPGAVLPTLLARWSMADSQGGLLFFAGWACCSLAALFVGRSRARSLAWGCAALAAGSFGMAFGSYPVCYLWMSLFGFGLGLTMTATSLLQAGRNPAHRGLELNRLNLVWALGACLCPSLAAHSLRAASVRVIFSAMGLFFTLLCLWTLVMERDPTPLAAAPAPATPFPPPVRHFSAAGVIRFAFRKLSLWPLAMVVAICLPTGIESSMGAWIAAYVQRTQHTIATTVTAGTCFWLGLLLSRTLSSFVLLLRRSERPILRQSLMTVVVGALLLIATQSSLGIVPGVFLIGFGLGPIYPLLLAMALDYSQDTAIFFVAGLGSAFLPWLTGIVSTTTASLRIGLLAPLAASMLMLVLGLRLAASPPKTRGSDRPAESPV